MSPEARERSFDELARELAGGSISRRRALRLMGAALVGGALGSLGIGGIAAAACVSPTGRCVRRTVSAVAASVLLRVHRMAAPVPAALSAVAATAPTALVVHLVGSGSATAPAQNPALLVLIVVLTTRRRSVLAASVQAPQKVPSAGLLRLGAVLVRRFAHVLPGSFV